MWYKICWKPENNSQLLFSALHLQSSSALGRWRVLAFGQKAPRPYPGAGKAGEEATVSFHAAFNRSHCHQAKPFDLFPKRDPKNQWQTVSAAWPGSLATRPRAGGPWRRLGCPSGQLMAPQLTELLVSCHLPQGSLAHWGGTRNV